MADVNPRWIRTPPRPRPAWRGCNPTSRAGPLVRLGDRQDHLGGAAARLPARLARRLRDRVRRDVDVAVRRVLARLKGTGIWGVNIPVGWGFAIVNFVWWIGIGHAGTLISAILLLFRQKWRMSISRFAEAMTIFAVMCAAIFPVFHTGRPWLAAYWLFPYPNSMTMWPNFRSPLMWDVFAVSTYATVSVLFWYIGLIPDLATMRDRAQRVGQAASTGCWRSAGAGRPCTGIVRNRVAAAGGPGDAAGALGPHGRELRLRCRAWSRAGTRRFSRRTSSPAPSTPASRWC